MAGIIPVRTRPPPGPSKANSGLRLNNTGFRQSGLDPALSANIGDLGLTLRDDVLPALGLQVGEAAAQLGVDRTTLSKLLNGRAAISPAMALRIERWLGRSTLKKTRALATVRSVGHRAA